MNERKQSGRMGHWEDFFGNGENFSGVRKKFLASGLLSMGANDLGKTIGGNEPFRCIAMMQ